MAFPTTPKCVAADSADMGTKWQLRRSFPGAIALAVTAMLVAACGGSAGESATVSDGGSADVSSFRYELTIKLTGGSSPFQFEQSGEVVLPDHEHATQSYQVSALRQETERVAIGEQVWLRGDLPWVDLGASPLGVIGRGGASGASFEAMTGSSEDLNGHATTRYDLTGEEFARLVDGPAGDIDESTTVTIWVSDEYGVPLRMQMSATDGDARLTLSLDVTDVNAPDIEVTLPAVAQAASLENGTDR